MTAALAALAVAYKMGFSPLRARISGAKSEALFDMLCVR